MKPTNKNILIEKIQSKTETASGIILKSSLEDDRAKVLSIGPEVTEVSVDDIIILNWNLATNVQDDIYIVPVTEVICIIE
jgi:co-chaperonin GroES (HSP10)